MGNVKNSNTPDRDYWFPTNVFPSNVKFTQITCADLDGTYALGEDELIYKWSGSYWQVAHIWHHVKAIAAESDANLDFEDFVGSKYWMNWIDFTSGGKSSFWLKPLSNQLVQLATFGSRYYSGNVVFGLDANHQFYLIDANGPRAIAGSPKLTCITSHIESYDPKTKKGTIDVWALGADGYIYKDQPTLNNNIITGGNWVKLNKPPTPLVQITCGNNNAMYGLDANNNVYEADGSAQNWKLFPHGSFKYISMGTDGSLWGIGTDGKAYRRLDKYQYFKISCNLAGKQYYLGGLKSMTDPNLLGQLTWATPGLYSGYIDEWEMEIVDGHDFQNVDVSRPMYLVILRPKGMSHAISAIKSTKETIINPHMVFDTTKEDEYIYFHLLTDQTIGPGFTSDFKGILMHTGCGMPISYPEEKTVNPQTQQQLVIARNNPTADEPIMSFSYSKT